MLVGNAMNSMTRSHDIQAIKLDSSLAIQWITYYDILEL